ncbi:hypothetical protein [Streptomyces sp. NPDC057257]|uniref:hypothetical protein n=1 Tax=Streptomyces sp. NPDC057257 TaxID=3346071 RepID=UPI0036409379
MAIESGLGWTTMSVDDAAGTARDIRSDCFNLDFSTPRTVQDITALTNSAVARLLLLSDITGTLALGFDDGSNLAHSVFKTVSTTSVNRTWSAAISGQTLTAEVICTDYAATRAQGGEFTFSVPFQNGDGSVPTWS